MVFCKDGLLPAGPTNYVRGDSIRVVRYSSKKRCHAACMQSYRGVAVPGLRIAAINCFKHISVIAL